MDIRIFLKKLSVLHISLCIGLTAIGLFVFWQNRAFTARMDSGNLLIYIVPIFGAGGYFVSQFLFRKRVQLIQASLTLPTKLAQYQKATIIKYALLEGPAILAFVAYYFTGNAMHLVIGVFLLIYLFVQRPTISKVIQDLPLTFEEQKQFDTFQD